MQFQKNTPLSLCESMISGCVVIPLVFTKVPVRAHIHWRKRCEAWKGFLDESSRQKMFIYIYKDTAAFTPPHHPHSLWQDWDTLTSSGVPESSRSLTVSGKPEDSCGLCTSEGYCVILVLPIGKPSSQPSAPTHTVIHTHTHSACKQRSLGLAGVSLDYVVKTN